MRAVRDPRQSLPGVKPGDRRVQVERPKARYFRYQAPGVLSAKLTVDEPTTPLGHLVARTRHALFGRPISSEAELTERLPKWKALPVFSSDVMSSVAYASEASLFTLLAAGSGSFGYLLPISIGIVAVLFIVTFSYRQTIRAYPNGGGSYIVARANLGVLPGLIACGGAAHRLRPDRLGQRGRRRRGPGFCVPAPAPRDGARDGGVDPGRDGGEPARDP